MEKVIQLKDCARCGSKSLERLKTHTYCVECNYFVEEERNVEPLIPAWAKREEQEIEECFIQGLNQEFELAI